MRTTSKKPPDPKPPWLGLYLAQNPSILGLSRSTMSQFFLNIGVILHQITLLVMLLHFRRTIVDALLVVRQEHPLRLAIQLH